MIYHRGWSSVLQTHDASGLSPNLLVLCATSDQNSKRDVCFGARNPSLLSLGINKEWEGADGSTFPLVLFFFHLTIIFLPLTIV